MNRINIKRLGGLGDVVMVLSIAKFLFNRGYTIDFTTGGHFSSYPKCSYISSTQILAAINEFKQY